MSKSLVNSASSADSDSEEIFNEAVFPDQVDNRQVVKDTLVHPFCSIGKLISRFNVHDQIKESYGTACILGPRLLLTAAHNLFNKFNQQKAYQILFIPETQNQQECRLRVIDSWIDGEYQQFAKSKNKNKKERGVDIAFLILEENSLIAAQKALNMNLSYDYNYDKQTSINITGYPGIKKTQFTASGLPKHQKQQKLYYRIPTEDGNSGGPVLIQNDEGYFQIIGVHKGSVSRHNFCILLSALQSKLPQIYSFLKQNQYDEILKQWKQLNGLLEQSLNSLQQRLVKKLQEQEQQSSLFQAISSLYELIFRPKLENLNSFK